MRPIADLRRSSTVRGENLDAGKEKVDVIHSSVRRLPTWRWGEEWSSGSVGMTGG
jgi:hypothetical protein